MNFYLPKRFFVHWLVLAFAFAGCSTAPIIVNQWSNPAYSSAPFKKIMVGAAGEPGSIRRNLEDEFVVQLRAAGIDALPSYRYLPQNGAVDEAQLKEAARKAGAQAVIFARSVSVERKTEYAPSYYPTPIFGVFGSHVGATWSGPFGAPTVVQYAVYTSEATLYDIARDELVWTATAKTAEPENVGNAIKTYAAAVIKALQERHLIAAGE